MTHSNLHKRWCGIIDRCKHQRKKTYQGITVCDEWKRFEPFMEWAIANGFNPKLHVDRIDNDKGYSPENCRWVTRRQNQLNSRKLIWAEVEGEQLPLRTACRKLGLKYRTIHARIRDYGWSVEEALHGRSIHPIP